MLKKLLSHSAAILLLSVVTGCAVALFLWLLDAVTHIRYAHAWLLYLLPAAGVAIYYLYQLFGKNSEKGNNLLLEEIHQPGAGVPGRMAPLVLAGTIITHLFGGSAGREGTAVQMGGSIAAMVSRWLRPLTLHTPLLLMAGIAAGFGAVFGTPLAGTVFALEVLAVGSYRWRAFIPCLAAALLADYTCRWWQIAHTHYPIQPGLAPFELLLLGKIALAGILFGLAAFLFAELTHRIKSFFTQIVPVRWLIPAIGGVILIALVYLLQTRDYLGLGVTSQQPDGVSLVNAFQPGGVNTFSWWWKLLFTAITLGCGMKGGEVTPLFFIGATLGNALAAPLGVPVDLLAATGFLAVFAGATNTPVACTLMGIELFGPAYMAYFAIGCTAAYLSSGHTGIYSSQLIAHPKLLNRRRHGHETTIAQGFQRRRAFTGKYLQRLRQLLR
ncbi:H+/Cl- antiporter ClcA [Filimonas zeae]|uniref:voltage-gated chloride channel family protein n=1 Tax=Filimonas zeae TaxID=1737353 RepID=UPI001E2F0CFB|nr:voltage-gated chloride channel family protein [Filimonas zeae]MDR6337919.1 H+/Cl- antiporter ClcA [Filimonas zeae]